MPRSLVYRCPTCDRRLAPVQAGGIDGHGWAVGDQAAVACGRDGALEEVEEAPPFNSRLAA